LQQRGFAQATAVYALMKKQHPELYLAEDYVNSWGYSLLRQGKKQPALELFKLNVQLYPASANTYDSLAEVYEATGDRDAAIQNYRRSLLLNPANTNATEHLQKLVTAGAKSNSN
jgi:D-alanyl-D-alanine-carboxypeptidase/D-alanyl-D-alanine-endopeptidase